VKAGKAPDLSMRERLNAALFGNPSFLRAQGLAHWLLPCKDKAPFKKAPTTKVFVVDRVGAEVTEGLPRIWLSEQIFNASPCERQFCEVYPNQPDKRGWHAFNLGERYFAEGLSYGTARGAELAQACYQAAEILWLHAASKGNLSAYNRLGILYEADLCQGVYWEGRLEHRALHHKAATPAERAFACFSHAAYRKHSESCWHVGDLYCSGKGCEQSHQQALYWYKQAFMIESLQENQNRAISGNAALRMGRAYEAALGCQLDFLRARNWYRIAALHLGAAFDEGQWHFKRERQEARLGVRRMAQEIAGRY
jgi:hypothetical protein